MVLGVSDQEASSRPVASPISTGSIEIRPHRRQADAKCLGEGGDRLPALVSVDERIDLALRQRPFPSRATNKPLPCERGVHAGRRAAKLMGHLPQEEILVVQRPNPGIERLLATLVRDAMASEDLLDPLARNPSVAAQLEHRLTCQVPGNEVIGVVWERHEEELQGDC
jgi:hypothetical protein